MMELPHTLDAQAAATRRAIALLGPLGQMISGSKSGYHHAHPEHLVVFNARVYTQEPLAFVWQGDLDVTASRADLRELATELGRSVAVVYEHGSDLAVDAVYTTDGPTESFRATGYETVSPDPTAVRGRHAPETDVTQRYAVPPATRRRRPRVRRADWRSLHSEADPRPSGHQLSLPDLSTLAAERVRGDPAKTATNRLIAWYDHFAAALHETVPPYCGAVWLHPADDVRLRDWVADPLRRRYSALRRQQNIGMLWLGWGPATSIHVPEGSVIIEPDACRRTRERTEARAKRSHP